MSKPTTAKKRVKRLSKADKEKIALDAAAKTYRESGEKFSRYVEMMDDWLTANCQKALNIFSSFDSDNLSALTYAQFKAGLRDLKIPCNDVELHLLCRLFDTDHTDTIPYNRLDRGMGFLRVHEEKLRREDIRPALVVTGSQRKMPHCSGGKNGCKMSKWDGQSYKVAYPRYLRVHFHLLSLDNFRTHPGHFTEVVPSHMTAYHLSLFIREQTSLQTTQVQIYTDQSRTTALSEEKSLEDYGFMGGPQSSPKELTLFYDYDVEFKDCPLLLCDHYFGRNIKLYNSQSQAHPQ